jgi:hypothetical protein
MIGRNRTELPGRIEPKPPKCITEAKSLAEFALRQNAALNQQTVKLTGADISIGAPGVHGIGVFATVGEVEKTVRIEFKSNTQCEVTKMEIVEPSWN